MKGGIKSHGYHMFVILGLFLSCSGGGAKQSTDVNAPERNRADAKEPTEESQERQIVFFGNSLTAGYGLEESQSFPALLQARLDSLSLPYVAVNAGLSGETSSGGLNRIDWVLNQPMDIFVLELGANDALRGLELQRTKLNLQGIIDKVRTKYPDIPIILAGMKAPPNMGSQYASAFESIYLDLAQQNDIDLIPFLLEGVAGNPALNLADGIHPNVAGQKIVLQNVWSVLKKHLLPTQ